MNHETAYILLFTLGMAIGMGVCIIMPHHVEQAFWLQFGSIGLVLVGAGAWLQRRKR